MRVPRQAGGDLADGQTLGNAALKAMARCRRHSSVRAAPPPGPTSRRERRLVGTPSPTDEPAAPISEATPAGPPIAPRINAVAITPLEGIDGETSRVGIEVPQGKKVYPNGRLRELGSRD